MYVDLKYDNSSSFASDSSNSSDSVSKSSSTCSGGTNANAVIERTLAFYSKSSSYTCFDPAIIIIIIIIIIVYCPGHNKWVRIVQVKIVL